MFCLLKERRRKNNWLKQNFVITKENSLDQVLLPKCPPGQKISRSQENFVSKALSNNSKDSHVPDEKNFPTRSNFGFLLKINKTGNVTLFNRRAFNLSSIVYQLKISFIRLINKLQCLWCCPEHTYTFCIHKLSQEKRQYLQIIAFLRF